MARLHQILLRESSNKTQMLRVTSFEEDAIKAAAERSRLAVSSFVKEVCYAAAVATTSEALDISVFDRMRIAAGYAKMPLSTWMRVVVLSSIKYSALEQHLKAAAGAAKALGA
jgi:hypothetical protein